MMAREQMTVRVEELGPGDLIDEEELGIWREVARTVDVVQVEHSSGSPVSYIRGAAVLVLREVLPTVTVKGEDRAVDPETLRDSLLRTEGQMERVHEHGETSQRPVDRHASVLDRDLSRASRVADEKRELD